MLLLGLLRYNTAYTLTPTGIPEPTAFAVMGTARGAHCGCDGACREGVLQHEAEQAREDGGHGPGRDPELRVVVAHAQAQPHARLKAPVGRDHEQRRRAEGVVCLRPAPLAYHPSSPSLHPHSLSPDPHHAGRHGAALLGTGMIDRPQCPGWQLTGNLILPM